MSRPEIKAGQSWEMVDTSRVGDERFWYIKGVEGDSKHDLVFLKCVTGEERKSVERQTLLKNYRLRYDGTEVGQVWEEKEGQRVGGDTLWYVMDIDAGPGLNKVGYTALQDLIYLKRLADDLTRTVTRGELLEEFIFRCNNVKDEYKPHCEETKMSLSALSELSEQIEDTIERCAEQKVEDILEDIETESNDLPFDLQENYKDQVISLLQDGLG